MTPIEDPVRAKRGSQKLLEHLGKNGEAPSIEEIKKAVALPPGIEYKVLNWLIRGIPPAYLELDATVQIGTADLAALVTRFVQLNDSAIRLGILINGIPFPDVATVRVTNSEGEE